MRILMVLDREFPPDIRVENEIKALLGAGHEIHLACFTRKNKPAIETAGQYTIHRKPISNLGYKSGLASLTLPFYFNFWHRFIADLLQQIHPDVIHVHDLPLVEVALNLRKNNPFVIADLHENWPAFVAISQHTNTVAGKILSPLFLWRKYERMVLPKTDAILVVVEEARDRLVNMGLPPNRIEIVSNTISMDESLLPATVDKHPSTVLYYAGGINHHRGLQHVISAMHLSTNKNLIFNILGEGSYRKVLEKLVDRYQLQNQVFFHGFQPFKTVMERLAEADFALIPHLKSEHTDSTIPHKLFQYMYAGKPVIASDCLPLKRIINSTGSGIVYPSFHPAELARIFDRLNELDYSEMARKGKQAVIDYYNWHNDSKRLVSRYIILESMNN